MIRRMLTVVAAGLAAVALGAAASAQEDEAAAEPEEPSEAEILASDLGLVGECLETLALRGAPGHVCITLVERQCVSEVDEETVAGTVICKAREADAWSALLDQRAAELEASMPNARREDFRNAQVAWGEFRDAECVFEAAAFRSESETSVARDDCLLRLTATRAIALSERARD